MYFLRRMPLSRLLLLCGAVVLAGISVTAIASALSSGPKPPPRPLAQAVHDALAAPKVDAFSARVTLTDHLLEGASLAGGSGGELASNPLIAGASGRIWASGDKLRLELDSEQGDTEVLYDGSTLEVYDAASNTLYRYTPKSGAYAATRAHAKVRAHIAGRAHAADSSATPTLAQIEHEIGRIEQHAVLSGATPTDVGGKAAYTVRISPKETGSLLGGAELSFDASNGTPLRAAIYSSTSSAPVIELSSEDVSYAPVESSIFEITPPAGVKLEQIEPPGANSTRTHSTTRGSGKTPHVSSRGTGLSSVAVIEESGKDAASDPLNGLPKVSLGSVTASELQTELGTILSFERGGVRYVLAGSVSPAALQAIARGL